MHYALCIHALSGVTRAAARLPGEDEVALAGQAAVTEDEVGVLDELKVSPFQALLKHMRHMHTHIYMYAYQYQRPSL